MIDLPSWLKINVPELCCPHCDQQMQVEGVISIGVRQSARDQGKNVLFFEYECIDCQNRAVVELNPMNLKQFCDCMFDNTHVKQMPKKSSKSTVVNTVNKPSSPDKKNYRSKITQDEVKKALKWVEECNNHDDFLLGIGLSQYEIDIYKSERDKKQ